MAEQKPGLPHDESEQLAKIEYTGGPVLPPRKGRASSGFVPLQTGSAARQWALLLLPSPWAWLAGLTLAAWRLLTLHALGTLLVSPWLDLALGAAADVALAHCMMSSMRLLAVLGSDRVEASGEVPRNASLAFAVLWGLITLLRLAGLVHASLHGYSIVGEFWVQLLRHPLVTLGQTAVWMALAVAAATAALARYCMTSDLDVPEVLQDVIPRPRLLAATGAVLVLSLVAALAIHAKSPGRPDAATTSPDITSLDSLARALQDPSLRRAGDE
jgi:hypothetical protein